MNYTLSWTHNGVVQTRTLAPRRDPHVSVTLRITGESALREAWLKRSSS